MSFLGRVNCRRAWFLFTMCWAAGVTSFYAGSVRSEYSEALVAKRERDRSIVNGKYNRCLEQQGTNWWKVSEQYRSECYKQALKTCGDARWCDAEHWRDFCIKTKVEACRGIGSVVEGDASEPLISGLSWEQDNRLRQWQFYFDSRFSQPLIEAISLAIGVPLLLALVPGFSRRVWTWLSTKQ